MTKYIKPPLERNILAVTGWKKDNEEWNGPLQKLNIVGWIFDILASFAALYQVRS